MSKETRRKVGIGLMVSSGVILALSVALGLLLWAGDPILTIDKESALAWVPGAETLGLTKSYDIVMDCDRFLKGGVFK